MIVKYDPTARAISVRLVESNPQNHSHCEELVGDTVIIDRDKDGTITAVEVLGIDGIEDYDGNKYKLEEK